MKEIQSHTALRGIAALLVVIYHYRISLPPPYNPDAYSDFFVGGYLWVDCFFMLSGFILSYVYGLKPGQSNGNAARFLQARFARIYPLHFVTLIGMAALYVALPLISKQRFDADWSTFALNLANIHAWGFLNAFDWNFPSWSISVEFAAYLLFPLVCLALARAFWPTVAIMLGCIGGALLLGHHDWERLALLHGVPMFFAGILIFYVPKSKSAATLQLPAVATLLIALHLGLPDVIIELSFVVLIYSTQTDEGALAALLKNEGLLALGRWSYSMYMLHIPVRVVYSLTAANHFGPLVDIVAMTAISVTAGALSYRYFEGPCRDWITGRRPVALGRSLQGL